MSNETEKLEFKSMAHDDITDEEVRKPLDIKRTRSFTLLKQMSEVGLVKIKGRGASRKITL